MAGKRLLGILAIAIVVGVGIAFIWAPVVPYERLVTIEVPSSSVLCPGTQVCHTTSYSMWARSYASFGYDYFGYGSAPFTGPVTLQYNGVVVVLDFNGTSPSPADITEYPSSTPEPFPILRVNALTVYPHGAPFGGSVTQISVTNLGVGETIQVNWGLQSQQIPAGATALLNSTDWTGGPLPAANSNYTLSLFGTAYYPKLWLAQLVTQSVFVTYST